MTTQHSSTDPAPPSTWGAPVPAAERPNRPWSTRKIVISAAVAVVIVTGGTIGVIAATNSGSTTAAGPGAGRAGGGFGRFGAGGGPGGLALANALHGDFVVSVNGALVTDRLQTGTVTAVSATDITLKSTDGYTQSYVINSGTSVDNGANTIGDVATGNTVTVTAALSGSTATANTLEDATLGGGGRGFGAGAPPAGGVPPGN
ncbi:MAG TPA: hypothetical protein VGL06_08010 [Pseudonocardiaceae bacterium]